MAELITLIISVASQAGLGALVLIKNPKRTVNKAFGLMSLSFLLWSVATYLSLHPIGFSQLVWVRLVLSSAALLCLSVLMNFKVFPNQSLNWTYKLKIIHLYTIFVIFMTQTPLVFSKLDYSSGSASPVVAPGIVTFMLLVVSYLGAAVWLLIRRFHHARGREKDQLRIVLFGLATTFTAIVITNFILVTVFNVTSLLNFGPAFTLIFSGSMAYAILRHKLFDIRAAAARAFAYILSLLMVVLLYSAIIVGLSSTFISGNELGLARRVLYISLAVITALIYPPVKTFFDKITNKIFFRETYDPQRLLDNLSNILISKYDVKGLTHRSSQLVTATLNTESCMFVVHPGTPQERIIGESGEVKAEPYQELIKLMEPYHRNTLVMDEINNEHDRHYVAMRDAKVGIVLRMVTQSGHIGYMLVGFKKSGDVFSNSDIRVLGIVADELAIAIESALRFDEIAAFNLTLQKKVDEATRQLRQTNEKLKALDETKDEFISMASHQLRTPLTSVKGYLSMVMEGDAGKITAAQRKLLDQAFVSSQRMVYLIADLLNVSRLRTGKFVIESKPTNLSELVEGEISQLKETAAGRNLELSYEKPDKFPELMLDENKIRQVVMNFVDNAIYYTPSGGHINVKVSETPEAVEVKVTDDGLGVPKAEQHHLFNKFYRAGNAKKARPDGTGLGLFMAKKVIIAQGGSIVFNSTEGKGSTFGFTFSKSKLAVPAHIKTESK